MQSTTTQKQAQKVAKQLDFCYLCGKAFTDKYPGTKDHVPPKKVFLPADRDWPLILRAHKKCNEKYSISDEQLKDLIALIHSDGQELPLKTSVDIITYKDGKPNNVGFSGMPMKGITDRILRGCYSALYGEFLPVQTPNYTLMPLVECDRETGDVRPSNFYPQHQHFCELLKFNRRIENLDQVIAYNEKFRFEIIWIYEDDQVTPVGIFCIDLYDWYRLSKWVLPRRQGCVGSFWAEIPKGASRVQTPYLHYKYKEPLNPFE